jgi:hypothetical protein
MNLRNAIARVEVAKDGKPITRGTAFLVTPDLALTALHIVASRAQPPKPLGDAISLYFPGHTSSASLVPDRFDVKHDWALLRCETPPGGPQVPLARRAKRGAKWDTYGFPDSNPYDGLGTGGIIRRDDSSVNGVRVLQLFSNEAAAGNGMPLPGYSGAPVEIKGAAVGVIRYALLDEKSHSVGGVLYATPMGVILDCCVDLLREHDRRLTTRAVFKAGMVILLVCLVILMHGNFTARTRTSNMELPVFMKLLQSNREKDPSGRDRLDTFNKQYGDPEPMRFTNLTGVIGQVHLTNKIYWLGVDGDAACDLKTRINAAFENGNFDEALVKGTTVTIEATFREATQNSVQFGKCKVIKVGQ